MDEKISNLLQTRCSITEYEQVTRSNHKGRFFPSLAADEYWRLIPDYKISECPFCRHQYLTKIDTYSLGNCPGFDELGLRFIASDKYEPRLCKHFLAQHIFINLDGHLPTEMSYAEFRSAEVPHIQLQFMNSLDTTAVLHSLPICKAIENAFKPMYVWFSMVYFVKHPEAVRRGHLALFNEVDAQAYDLLSWAKRGRLKWLDIEKQGLALADSGIADFPYLAINGRRRGFYYRQGHIYEAPV